MNKPQWINTGAGTEYHLNLQKPRVWNPKPTIKGSTKYNNLHPANLKHAWHGETVL